MKTIWKLAPWSLLLAIPPREANAQIPVTDAANLANNRVAQSENIAKWIESIQRLREQIDALNRQINIQSDIRRWAGNPVEASAKMALEGLGGPELARQ